MLAWSEQHVMQMSPVEVPSSPITSTAEVPVQPVVKTKVPKRQPQLPPPDVVPTPWEREFLEKNRNDLYELLLVSFLHSLTNVIIIIFVVGCKLFRCKEINGYIMC